MSGKDDERRIIGDGKMDSGPYFTLLRLPTT